jgi:predicted ATPase
VQRPWRPTNTSGSPSSRPRNALPWRDLAALLRRAIGNAIADHAAAATRDRRMFFDHGLVDAATIASCHQIDSR